MPFTLKQDPALGLVEVTFTGLITGTDLRDAVSKCISLQKQTGTTRFLVEAFGCDVGATFFEIYDIPDKQSWKEEFNRQSRVAVILPDSAKTREAAQFYQTACQNRGWYTNLCLDRQSAMEWLTGTNATGKLAAGQG